MLAVRHHKQFLPKFLLVLLCASSSALPGLAQTPQPKVARPVNLKGLNRKKREALLQIQPFIERVLKFQKIQPRINGVVAFGDLLWQIDQDYARSLFVRAFDLMTLERPVEISDKNQTSLTRAEIAQLRANILNHLARHDSQLALKLSESVKDVISTRDKVRSAINALDEPTNSGDAVKLAERGLDEDLAGWALTMVAFLQKLQRVDKVSANELFLRILAQLPKQAGASANDVLTIGTFIYTSPLLAAEPAMKDRDGAVLYMSAGGAQVIDITANRENATPSLIGPYLTTAVAILARQARTSADPELDLAALRLLLAKAQISAPDLVPLIGSGIQSISARIAPSGVDGSPLEKDDSAGLDPNAELTKAEDLSGDRRDGALFSLAFTLYQRGDFERAISIGEKIDDLSGRQKLINLIRFALGLKQLESGDMLKPQEIANGLTGSARAALKVAIASRYAQGRDRNRALEALLDARDECNRLSGDSRKPYLLLAVASAVADLDHSFGVSTLRDAISSFNSSERVYPQWFEPLQIGDVSREFVFSSKLLTKDLPSCIEHITKVEPNATIALVLTLSNESLQGEALVAISKTICTRTVF